ncbi:O-antigen polymerase [Acinetobacter sp. BSP-28]|uniref:O-antigen polymerase n=1 Tax=Acinetobacter sp. BSP-28 TaxID=3344661 RepID=UPI00377075E3
MNNVFFNNKLIYSLFFITYNLICFIIYYLGLGEGYVDNIYLKLCEFLYVINFILSFFLLRIYRIDLFSPQGLFLISFSIFTLGRVFLSLFDLYHNYYELIWGELFYFKSDDYFLSFLFWQISLSSFLYGSVLFSSLKTFNFSNRYYNVYKFINLFCILVLLLIFYPISFDLISIFFKYGYEGLYTGQINYDFGYTRIASLLLPIMIASSVVLNNKKIIYISLFVLGLYILINLLVGQRALLFMWVLILLWLYSVIHGKTLPVFRIVLLGTVLIFFAQFLESFRGGRDDFLQDNPLIKFIYVQSLTYTLPSIVINNFGTSWPILTYITMFIPIAGLSSILGLVNGTHNFSSGSFFAYSLNKNLFEEGYGLGWSIFLDLLILGNMNYFILSIFSFILGVFYCFLIEKAKNNIIYFYVLIASLPAFMFGPRSLLYSISSSIIYSLIVFFLFLFLFYKKRM